MNANTTKVFWTRANPDTKESEDEGKSPILLGARIRDEWLREPMDVAEISFTGDLLQAMLDLSKAARESKDEPGYSLPIRALRATLAAKLESLIYIDQKLGLDEKGPRRPSIILHGHAEIGIKDSLTQPLVDALKSWHINTLDKWAESFDASKIAQRIQKAIHANNLQVMSQTRMPATSGPRGSYDYRLIIQRIAERLIGEDLFEGMGACEIVSDPESSSNAIELMTVPQKMTVDGGRSDIVFSMVAKVSAITVPYDNHLYLRVAASKRTWSSKAPNARYGQNLRETGYIMAPNGRFSVVPIRRNGGKGDAWAFGDEYSVWKQHANGLLPKDITEACAQRIPSEGGWWAGIPEITTLFRRVSSRTVYENDEIDLRNTIVEALKDSVVDPEIEFRTVLIPTRRKTRESTKMAVLKLEDLGVMAGEPLLEDEPEFEQDEESRTERPKVQDWRTQNREILQTMHSGAKPVIWAFCRQMEESKLIKETIDGMFGDAVEVRVETLPEDTHGLKQDLPGSQTKSTQRFSARVRAWEEAAKEVAQGPAPRYALICAPDKIQNKDEDPVNYFAGMHAMCSIGKANVHHVLPIGDDNKDEEANKTNFIIRVQSAVLDVLFAHSGLIYGVAREFRHHFGNALPEAIYGVQVINSFPRYRSGETRVSFFAYTRILVTPDESDEIPRVTQTEIQFVYSGRSKTDKTPWMSLSEGLRWLASQRDIDGSDAWIRDKFESETRVFLGEINKTHPRALVLVDWQSVSKYWSGLRDADLTSHRVPKISNMDISAICKQMTLVRIRHGYSSMTLRAMASNTYRAASFDQENTPQQSRANPVHIGDTYTHRYGTTTKMIVAIPPQITASPTTTVGHYIMSMTPRSTVQIVRGKSCYRSLMRMRRKQEDKLIVQEYMQPGMDDIALPAPLEVTVMQCPPDVNPDAVAMAVMALRVGFTHYRDYGKLPSPLFFRRKIDDYVIRYRSNGGGPESGNAIDQESEELVVEPDTDTNLDRINPAILAPDQMSAQNRTASVQDDRKDEHVAPPLMEALTVDTATADTTDYYQPDSADLLTRAKGLAKKDILLYRRESMSPQRKAYNAMLTKPGRVSVALPYFVTQESIFGNQAPFDRSTMGRFWRELKQFDWVKGACPPSGQFQRWIMSRLGVPQGGVSLSFSRLFPPIRLFPKILESWKGFCKENVESGDDDLSAKEVDLSLLTSWAVKKGDDELLGWIVFSVAQLPFKNDLDGVFAEISEAPGPATLAALQYFCDCACAAQQSQNPVLFKQGIHFPAGPITMSVQELATPYAIEQKQSVIAMHSQPEVTGVSLMGTPPTQQKKSIGIKEAITQIYGGTKSERQILPLGVIASPQSSHGAEGHDAKKNLARWLRPDKTHNEIEQVGIILEMAGMPEPGDDLFEDGVAELREALDYLEARHHEVLERRAQEQRAQEEEEKQRAADHAKWQSLREEALAVKTQIEETATDWPELVSRPIGVIENAPPDIAAARQSLNSVSTLIYAAHQAKSDWEDVEQKSHPQTKMTPIELTRHRKKWAEALDAAASVLEVAYNAVIPAVESCPLFTLAPANRTVSTPLVSDAGHDAPKTTNIAHVSPQAGPIATLDVPEPSPAIAAATVTPTNVKDMSDAQVQVTATAEKKGAIQVSETSQKSAEAPPSVSSREVQPARTSTTVQSPLEVEFDQLNQPADDPINIPSENPVAMPGQTEFPDGTTLKQRAAIISRLIRQKALMSAEVYAEAMELSGIGPMVGDHPIIMGAALREIRRVYAPLDLEPVRQDDRRAGDFLMLKLSEGDPDGDKSCTPVAMHLGVLAAGLNRMLFIDADGAARWTFLQYLMPRFLSHAPLKTLMSRIENLEGFAITEEDIAQLKIGARSAAHRHLEDLRQKARTWHQNRELYLNWTAPEYRLIHNAFFNSETTAIGRCLMAAAKGVDLPQFDATLTDAQKQFDTQQSSIEEVRRKVGRRMQIVGQARAHIMKNIRTTAAFLKDYREVLARSANPQTTVAANVRSYLLELYEDVVAALDFVAKMTFDSPLDLAYQDLAVAALNGLKMKLDCDETELPLTNAEQLLLLPVPMNAAYTPSMRETEDVRGNRQPCVVDPLVVMREVESLSNTLEESGDPALDPQWHRVQMERAFESHLADRRTLPAEGINRRFLDGARNVEFAAAVDRCRIELKDSLNQESQRVLHAMAVAGLAQTDANAMLEVIDDLKITSDYFGDSTHPLGVNCDFPHAMSALRNLVRMRLDASIEQAAAKLKRDAQEFFDTAKDNVSKHDRDRILAVANQNTASSMRTAADMLSLLKEGALPPQRAQAVPPSVEYEKFIALVHESSAKSRSHIETAARWLTMDHLQDAPEWISGLTSEEREDAANVINTWIELTNAPKPRQIEDLLKKFMGILGIEINVGAVTGAQSKYALFYSEGPFAGLEGGFIPPVLGSLRGWVQGVLMRETKEALIVDTINQLCQGATSLLLTKNSYSLEKRAALSRNNPVLIFDDDLVLYGALHPKDRVIRMLKIALLTFHDMPYDDYGMKPVPIEMFFGRRQERLLLRNVKSSAVLYGGRRLGKSSLLYELLHDAQNRHAHSKEAVVSIPFSTSSDGEDHVLHAWQCIYTRLVQSKFVARPASGKDPQTARAIREYLEEMMISGQCSKKQLYMLIDEADEVMGLDLNSGGKFVNELQRLCEAVHHKCQIRFVIAGLHNLTRMANDENSPLGKFDAIALKPFWSPEDIQRGIDLITVPLAGLGFYFPPGKEDLPLRIMALCSFYPALIQLYCKQLLSALYNRRASRGIPTIIQEEDLDSVENNPTFRREIQTKFEWTLNLDKRYKAIALILADHYYSGSPGHGLTVPEIRDLCTTCFPEQFKNTVSGVYDSLLDEMEILTIVDRVKNRYVLRTHNIVTMLGNREDVETLIDELASSKDSHARSRNEVRSPLIAVKGGKEAGTFPLPSSWTRTTLAAGADRDAIVLVGNALSGIGTLSQLKEDHYIGEHTLQQTPNVLQVKNYQSAENARTFLVRETRLTRDKNERRLNCVATDSWKVKDLPLYGSIAATIAPVINMDGTTRGPVRRLVLLASPERAYDVAKEIDLIGKDKLPGWRVVSVPEWSEDAIYFRKDLHDKSDIRENNAAIRSIIRATCGFGHQVDALCSMKSLSMDTIGHAYEEAMKKLAPDLETFYRNVGIAPSISKEELASIQDVLMSLKNVKREEYSYKLDDLCQAVQPIVTPAMLRYFQWMGLLQESPDGTWHVPELYARLLT